MAKNNDKILGAEEITVSALVRANRITVQNVGTGYKADFYKTHKHIATLMSEDTSWKPAEDSNKTAQREDFRKYAIDHCADIGVLWNPADMRTEDNKRIAKYADDIDLLTDAYNMVIGDMHNLYEGLGIDDLEWISLAADSIIPMTITSKGNDLSKLGVIDGKYEKSGNWAWANIEMTLTLKMKGIEIYYAVTCNLVSGQLKKPHITKTSFAEEIKKSLQEVGLWEEEVKAENPVKAEEVSKPKAKAKGKAPKAK